MSRPYGVKADLSSEDYASLCELSGYIGCSNAEAVRQAIRFMLNRTKKEKQLVLEGALKVLHETKEG